MIKKCTCTHKSQDELHGPGNRVFTEGQGKITCSVCGRVVK